MSYTTYAVKYMSGWGGPPAEDGEAVPEPSKLDDIAEDAAKHVLEALGKL